MDGQGCIYKILYTLGMAIRSGVSSGRVGRPWRLNPFWPRGRLAVSRAGLRQRLQAGVASGLRQSGSHAGLQAGLDT